MSRYMWGDEVLAAPRDDQWDAARSARPKAAVAGRVSGRGALSGCPGCGDPKDHDGRAGQRLACVSMAQERTWAIEWLAGATGMPVAEAERAVDAMRRTAGIRAGVRALDALLDLGWRPGGER